MVLGVQVGVSGLVVLGVQGFFLILVWAAGSGCGLGSFFWINVWMLGGALCFGWSEGVVL